MEYQAKTVFRQGILYVLIAVCILGMMPARVSAAYDASQREKVRVGFLRCMAIMRWTRMETEAITMISLCMITALIME